MSNNQITTIAYELYHDGIRALEEVMIMYGMTEEEASIAIDMANRLNENER